MKNFSHSRDSTYWATEYPCSYSVLSLESISETRAKARPLLAVVMPVTEFKCCAPNNQLSSWLVLMQVILFLVQIFRQCLSTVCKLVSFFLFNEVSYFLRPSQVPGTSFLPFLICQHLSFVTWCFARVVASFCTFYLWVGSFLGLFFFFPFCVSGVIPEEGGK